MAPPPICSDVRPSSLVVQPDDDVRHGSLDPATMAVLILPVTVVPPQINVSRSRIASPLCVDWALHRLVVFRTRPRSCRSSQTRSGGLAEARWRPQRCPSPAHPTACARHEPKRDPPPVQRGPRTDRGRRQGMVRQHRQACLDADKMRDMPGATGRQPSVLLQGECTTRSRQRP